MKIKLAHPIRSGLCKVTTVNVRPPSVGDIMRFAFTAGEASEYETCAMLISACTSLSMKSVLALSMPDFVRLAEAAGDVAAAELGEEHEPNANKIKFGERSGIPIPGA